MRNTPRISSSILALTFASTSQAIGQVGSGIVHDAEYYVLEAQSGDVWKAEDRELDDRLAALREEHGRPPEGERRIRFDLDGHHGALSEWHIRGEPLRRQRKLLHAHRTRLSRRQRQ